MKKKMTKKSMAVLLAATTMIGATGCGERDYVGQTNDSYAAQTDDSYAAQTVDCMPASESSSALNNKSNYAQEACETEAEYAIGATNAMIADNCVEGCWDPTWDPSWNPYYGMPDFNTEEYNAIRENSFMDVATNPLSTFAADVDTGSYCNLRRMILNGYGIQNVASSIRVEEIINYFDYEMPNSNETFSMRYELGDCPWNDSNKLMVLTIQTNAEKNLPDNGSNFVFLIDSSGSMNRDDKLPLAIEGFKLLASTLGEDDRVSIVTYSGDSHTLLEGSNSYREIVKALDSVEAGGGTNGSGGIEAAYKCAEKNFIKNGNNRVIIASDGDMNLGITSQGGLVDLISEKKESGVFLTVLGFGSGNYSDANMESIADAGNGNYYYIDQLDEAKRVLVDKLKETTITVAKDVKFQIEFNPAVVSSYRQIGYENRQMAAQDFSDDTKDGGEIGAGQQVTIAYELEMTGKGGKQSELKYQDTTLSKEAQTGEVCTVSIRYKYPDGDTSKLLEYPIEQKEKTSKEYFGFVAGIIEATQVIRDSQYSKRGDLDDAYALVHKGSGKNIYRQELAELLLRLGAND